MVHTILKVALLVQFLCVIAEVAGQSPCPNIFRYTHDEETNEIMGVIEIPSPPRGIALDLSVGMSIAAALPTKYVGRLELAQSREESVRAVQQGRSLRYRIHFPLRHPTPILTGLWFNNKQVCTGPRAVGPVVTSIVLNHTLYPPGVLPLSEGQGNVIPSESKPESPPTISTYRPVEQPYQPPARPYQPELTYESPELSYDSLESSYQPPAQPYQPPARPYQPPARPYQPPAPQFYPQPVPQPTPSKPVTQSTPQSRPPPRPPTRPTARPTARPTVTPHLNKPWPPLAGNDSSDVCGRSTNVNNINLLIVRGTKTSPGQWPWLAAIFVIKTEYEFQCAGTLVSNNHILTAAHCFQGDNGNLPAGLFLVSLGRYRLRDWREKGSVNREMSEYKVHPDYKPGGSADADLAIIVLREKVEYSATIKPICLWSSGPRLEDIVGKFGFVVGWGQDELGNAYLQEPRMARVPVVAQEVCLWSNANFVSYTSNRTFCAGARNGSGPCNGDSGSGLVIQDPRTGRYHLRGVVSLSLLDSNSMTCDLMQYIVYVDVAVHLQWVQLQIAM